MMTWFAVVLAMVAKNPVAAVLKLGHFVSPVLLQFH